MIHPPPPPPPPLFDGAAMMGKVWKTIGSIILAVVDVQATRCRGIPWKDRHIRYQTGEYECYLWGPTDTEWECCIFCLQTDKTFAAQLIDSGKWMPDHTSTARGQQCCCYAFGEVIDGSDGTLYYF